MNLGIITSRYPTKHKPYNHMFVHKRALEMISMDVTVTVYVPSAFIKEYTYEGVKVKNMPSKNIIKEITIHKVLYLHLLNIYPFSKADGWLIYKYIMRQNISFALYVHGSEVQKYSARLFEFNYKITDVLKWIKKDILVIPKIKKFLNNTKNKKNVIYLFPSNWMKKNMEENLGLKLKKYDIVPNGIDVDYYKFNDTSKNRYKLLTIRSLSQRVYNIEQTIAVMQLLPEKYTLVIYGEGIYRKSYQQKILQLGLDHRIKIINTFLEKDQMRDVYKNYGIFISTTRMDSQGITMMEAMSSGLLVVTTNNSSKSEFIINNNNGILGLNEEELAKAIIKTTNNNNTFLQITKKGRESMEKINLKKTVDIELSILKSLLS